MAVAVAGEEGRVEFESQVVVLRRDAELLSEGVAHDRPEQHVRGAPALETDRAGGDALVGAIEQGVETIRF